MINSQNAALWQSSPIDANNLGQQQQHSTPQLPPSPYYNGQTGNIDNDSTLSAYNDINRKSRNGSVVNYTNLIANKLTQQQHHQLSPQHSMTNNNNNNNVSKSVLNQLNSYHAAQQYNQIRHSGQSNHNYQQHDNYQQSPTFVPEAMAAVGGGESMFSAVKLDSPYNITGKNESIGVHLMGQEDNWCDNTTAITANTSDHSGSFTNLSRIDGGGRNNNTSNNNLINKPNLAGLSCELWSSTIISSVLSICVFLSPILMVVLPKFEILDWKTKECGPECDGLMISFVFKLLILLVGSWAVFFRRPKATLPRVDVYRSCLLAIIVVLIFSYWLFYSVHIADKRFIEDEALSYHSIVQFALSLLDSLLFVHYLSLILLEIRHLDSQFVIKVVRSPDGYSRYYTLGNMSIQRASVWVLEKYYQDFPAYNAQLERIALRRNRRASSGGRTQQPTTSNSTGMKFYDVDGLVRPSEAAASVNSNGNANDKASAVSLQMNPMQLSPKSILAQNTAANAGGGGNARSTKGSVVGIDRRHDRHETASHHSGHSDRHSHRRASEEQHEYERRIKKRRTRLVAVTEEAFSQIKRVHQNSCKCCSCCCLLGNLNSNCYSYCFSHSITLSANGPARDGSIDFSIDRQNNAKIFAPYTSTSTAHSSVDPRLPHHLFTI